MDFHQLGHLKSSVGGVQPASTPNVQKPSAKSGPDFAETLKDIQGRVGQTPSPASANQSHPLSFSKHAIERIQSRQIGMGPEKMQRLEKAFDKAASKGSKNTLVLMDDNAFIMSVKNKTIVTAMDKAGLKENLFTNIDSTIII